MMYTRTHKPLRDCPRYRLAYWFYHSLLALTIILSGSLPLAATPSPTYPALLYALPVVPTLAERGRALLTAQGDVWVFDARQGLLAVGGAAVAAPLAITADAAGFLTLRQQDQIWSSNPASKHFAPALTGVNTYTVQELWVDSRGVRAVTLNGWSAPGELAIASAAPLHLTGAVEAQRLLTLHAPQLTVSAELHAADLRLAAADWVSIEAAASLQARNGDQGGRIQVTGRLISNVGRLEANGDQGGAILLAGERLLQAGAIIANGGSGAGGQVQLTFQHNYIATANSRITVNGSQSGGAIRLDGGTAGRLYSSGRVQALGVGANGGDLLLLGKEIVLAAAQLDASGVHGGRIRIGGGAHGRDPGLPNAQQLAISPATRILADAGLWGNGGEIRLWAEQGNDMQGTLSARGGRQGGDGGVIETSARRGLQTTGAIQLAAPAGKAGKWQIDPKYLTISNAATGRFPQFALLDPTPAPGDQFGQGLRVLSNGNIVVPDPHDDFGATDAGAVHLFDGFTGALLSTLTGSSPNDGVGADGVAPLTNGNYIVCSTYWNNGAATSAGAVTWGNGASGISGVLSAANSLVGTQTDDKVGISNDADCGGVTVLTNGNYVVSSPYWDNGALTDAGAATWGNGSSGVTGAVATANSLVGGQAFDLISIDGITALTNGNYVVSSGEWDNGTVSNGGAATWGDGGSGISGVVAAANSLVGRQVNDHVGGTVTALHNGHYVVSSRWWDNGSNSNVGAVTWGNGAGGSSGAISALNSLVGAQPSDFVGGGGVTALSNGNYVVSSPDWNNHFITDAGAATWGNGAGGSNGVVGTANSLIGATADDAVGAGGVVALPDGNYVVSSWLWDNGAVSDAGAVTWGNGVGGSTGAVALANSLVGTQSSDQVGFKSVTVLSNGNYVVSSPFWDNGAVSDAGSVTWVTGGSSNGAVSLANSLVGAQSNDQVGAGGVTALTNGNYVVSSYAWDNGAISDAGAATWVDGSTGFSGVVAVTNSLVGTTAGNSVGAEGVTALANGNYVVRSSSWDSSEFNVGAVTWGNGASGMTGVVSAANSLIGIQSNDQVGAGNILPLHNGDYVVVSAAWDQGAVMNAGAATWVDGSTGQTLDGQSFVTAQNSLLGTAANSGLGAVQEAPLHIAFVSPFLGADNGQVLIGFADPAQLVYRRGQGQTIAVTPDLLARTLNSGAALTLQANSDLTLNAPLLIDNPNGNGGTLTLQAGRTLNLNADLSSDGAPVTLIANATLAQGVVDPERDPGAATLTMAPNTSINAAVAEVQIELADGAGKSHAESSAITLQTIAGSGLIVKNLGTSPNSDITLAGPVTTSQAQFYAAPNGLTTVAADLTTSNAPIYFANNVVIKPGVKLDTGLLEAVEFTGTTVQTLQTDGAILTHLQHSGTGTVRLLDALNLNGYLHNSAGSFESNGHPLTVLGATTVSGGLYRPGVALQSLNGGFTMQSGATLLIDLLGATPKQNSKVLVNGPVDLTGGALQLNVPFRPALDTTFVLIDNDGNDAVVGTFAGLPEGATPSAGAVGFRISYQGGDGNDVTLTVIPAAAVTPVPTPMPTPISTPVPPGSMQAIYLPLVSKGH